MDPKTRLINTDTLAQLNEYRLVLWLQSHFISAAGGYISTYASICHHFIQSLFLIKVRESNMLTEIGSMRRSASLLSALCFAAAGLLSAALETTAVLAADLAVELPVDCEMGKVCTIQNYFDHDPGPGRMDYACGRLSYDGHKGTDIRVPDLPTMRQGVPVVAAAPGVVKAIRDGMQDINIREIGLSAVKGREAGNGVLIDHGGGWHTQYSHLKKGSVSVARGDRVEAGQQLGLIGMSGKAEFPHVEFTVRHNGENLDPFVGLRAFSACGDERRPLWSPTALDRLAYQETGALVSGFATTRPKKDAARDGAYNEHRLPIDAPALVFWVDVFGTMKGDVQTFRIEGPDGRTIHESQNPLSASNVSWFAFSGRERREGEWAPGIYRGSYTLTRDGKAVLTIKNNVLVGDRG
jgi:murein DD-endopeptidase MepM/ murein hydrolase activator NlpD